MNNNYQQFLNGAFDLVCFDLETNGFETDTAIVEIGAIKIKAGMLDRFPEDAEEFHSLITFDGIPNAEAFATHKIPLSLLREKGNPLKDVLTRFTHFTNGAALLGQNIVNFDLRILNYHLARYSLALQCPAVFDTRYLAKELLNIPSYSLVSLVSFLGVDHAPTHRSLDDVIATIKVFQKLIQRASC